MDKLVFIKDFTARSTPYTTHEIIAALVDVGMDYQQIKETLLKTERAGA